MQTAHLHAMPARLAAAVTGCTLALLIGVVSGMKLDARSPVVAGLAIAVALWLAWMVFDFAFAPMHPPHDDTPAPDAEDDPRAFADTEAGWRSA